MSRILEKWNGDISGTAPLLNAFEYILAFRSNKKKLDIAVIYRVGKTKKINYFMMVVGEGTLEQTLTEI